MNSSDHPPTAAGEIMKRNIPSRISFKLLVLLFSLLVAPATGWTATYSLSIDNVTVDESAGNAVFTVTSDTAIESGTTLTVDYASADGTATAGSDYTTVSGTASISVGKTTTITVPIIDDAQSEENETFTVTLFNPMVDPSGNTVAIGKATGTCTILDNDTTPPLITVTEDSPFGTVTPAGDANYQVSVSYGGSQTFAIAAANPCPNGLSHNGHVHHISDIIVDGQSVAGIKGGGYTTYDYTFNNVTRNHTIEILFTSYIDVTVHGNGQVESPAVISTAGSIEVESHADVTLLNKPNDGYHVSKVEIDGTPIGQPGQYTINDLVDTDHTYEVWFTINSFTLEPVSRFGTIYDTSAQTTKATTREVAWETDSSFYVDLNDPLYAVLGILIDNISYPIPGTGASKTYSDFVLTNTGDNYLEVKFTNIVTSHRLEAQDYDTSPISDIPLDARVRPKPASLMFVLDDSGSMDWETIVPGSSSGTFDWRYYVYSYPNVAVARAYGDNSLQSHGEGNLWRSQWSGVNKMFYNPAVTYTPWPTFTGTPSSNLPAVAADGEAHANIYRPRYHPWNSIDCPAAIDKANGVAGADLGNCDTTTYNNNTFNMDKTFMSFQISSTNSVVDNTDADFTHSGNWRSSSSWRDYGRNYLYTNSASATKWATWSFTPGTTEPYDVSVWWVNNNSRKTNVPYTVTCSHCSPSGTAGSTTLYVNQRVPGGKWYSLGTFNFTAGETATVTLTDNYNRRSSSCADAARIAPASATINIINAHYFTWDDKNGDNKINYVDANHNGQMDPGETVNEDIYLVNLTDPIEYYKVLHNNQVISGSNLQRVAAADLPATVKTFAPPTAGDTWRRERQNWADWFSYYRKRIYSATAAIAQVINRMSDVEVGYRTINYSYGGYENGGYGFSQPLSPVKVSGEGDQTNRLLQLLYAFQIKARGTPLRRGLKTVGQYYDDTDGVNPSGLGHSPFHARQDGDECKQAFTIALTDGYWNGNSPNVGNVDGTYGPPFADSYSNTLADVAMKYYEKDLSTLPNLVPDSTATWQHMVTYTVAFGVNGTLNPADYNTTTCTDTTYTDGDPSNDCPPWPRARADSATAVDDLWHAAVDGHGLYMNAARPDELVKSLLAIMKDIGNRIGSGAAVSVNGDEMYETVNDQIRMFQTSYNSGDWHGDLKSFQLNPTTGAILTTPVWSAEAKMKSFLAGSGSGSRVIATYNGTNGEPFRLADLSALQRKELIPYFARSRTAADVVNYLRGDKTYEGDFRTRSIDHPLGDFIHSLARYQDGFLYVGGNDGMLHAFYADDVQGGKELFAYVPGLVYANLRQLSDPLYGHKYFVDNTPYTKKIGATTLLVGGLGKGGKGYYCLDITDAANITSEAELASRVKWEFPAVPATLLTGATFTFSSGSGSGGNDEIKDSASQFTSAGFAVGKHITIAGADYNDGVSSGTNDGTYKILAVSPGAIEIAPGSLINHYGDGQDIIITKSTSDPDMGYSFSRAFLVKSNDSSISNGTDLEGWVVIFGNGYDSEDGKASLYILNAEDGTLLKKIDTGVGPFNGLSTPNVVDENNDLKADYVYVGDLLGNMWKFDLTSKDYHDWQVAYCDNASTIYHCNSTVTGMVPRPLFAGLTDQPITAAPDVTASESGYGNMVIFGTGKYLGEPDLTSTAPQSIYGIWDWAPDNLDNGYAGVRVDTTTTPTVSMLSNWPETDVSGNVTHTLLRQHFVVDGNITEDTNGNGVLDPGEDANNNGVLDTYSYYRILSNYAGDWGLVKTSDPSVSSRFYGKDINGDGDVDKFDLVPTANVGWVVDLPGKIDLDTGKRIPGERVTNDTIIRNGRAIVISFGVTGTRCNAGAYSFLNELDPNTGGMLGMPVFDLNGDGEVTSNDFVYIPYDVNGDGTIEAGEMIKGNPSSKAFEGRLFNPAILRENSLNNDDNPEETKYFSSSQGGIKTLVEPAEDRGVYFWQQIE